MQTARHWILDTEHKNGLTRTDTIRIVESRILDTEYWKLRQKEGYWILEIQMQIGT